MVSRKRARQEMEAESPPHEPSLLDRIRNMWEFANLGQYLFIFGKAIKVDQDLDIEDLETELLKPHHSETLSAIGLALLKFVSSHRGLTPDLFDEYSRRQYQARLPKHNPFGDEEAPKSFTEFDVFTKIRVLYQLSQWTMIHSDRIRERMPEQKDTEQVDWRIEPAGWDAKERTYFILDDNRLYRRTDPPSPSLPAPKPKKNSKKAKAAARASKRRKVSGGAPENRDGLGEEDLGGAEVEEVDDGFGGMKWECVAVTLEQFKEFVESIRRSRHPDEKELHDVLVADVLPVLEQQAEERKKKEARRERELLALEKLATVKRSSRIASKLEKQREEEEAIGAERKRQADLIMARREQEMLKKMEQDRESRILTRERRLREREMKRILHEEELANLSEDSKKLEAGEARKSERQLKSEIEKHKQALEEYTQEEDWIFDCSDDGSHSVACEKCNIWQHSACLGISQEEAERSDFQFICKSCKRRIEDEIKSANSPKITLKFRLGSSFSPAGRSGLHINGGTQDHKVHKTKESYVTPPSSKILDHSVDQQRPDPARTGAAEPRHAATPHLGGHQLIPSTSNPVFTNGITTSGYAPVLPPPNTASYQTPITSPPHTNPNLPQTFASESGLPLSAKAHPLMSSPTHGNKEAPKWGFPPSVSPHSVTNGVDCPLYPPPASPRHQIHQLSSPGSVSVIPPGLSPTKNTPSRPLSSHSLSGTQVLPPIATLSPSPVQQDLCPPSKGMTPEQLRSTNGQLVHQH
ncbi:hypothetical protein FGG08_000904 [Glutinoglossum americanum]|uniref:Zinc finger PHD-type domain-containing protein n=1 Tax=Glutinoglossum americanum TaxID=1670608 RepID=A0A9P8L0S5_9PEZI|nr:hypothetical protein FGG08_000904 [Glutinoglossum americanum]